MGQRRDGFEHISLPDKQPTLRAQRLLVQALFKQRKEKPSYATAVQLQHAQRDLSEMTQLTVINGDSNHEKD